MRDSALKHPGSHMKVTTAEGVGEELMRDSALKPTRAVT